MASILSYLRLIRAFNLFIMVITMILTRKFLLETMVQLQRYELRYPDFQFALVALSTALMAAGGYIVNDIFDREADRINKPNRMLVGTQFSVNAAWTLYWVHTVLGAAIGVYLAFHIGITQLAVVPLVIVGLLWFYTTSYKKIPLIGNVIISLFTGFVPLVVGLFEQIAERKYYKTSLIDIRFVAAYALFAFVISMVREIVKDLEDMEGDSEEDNSTMPLAWGVNISKSIALLFLLALLVLLGFVEKMQFQTGDKISLVYFVVFISLPSLWLMWLIFSGKSKADFRLASHVSKVVMLTGISSMVVFWYTLQPILNPQPKDKAPEELPRIDISVGK